MTLAEEQAHVQSKWIDIVALEIAWESNNSWHEAYLFTKQREAEIMDLEEEIGFLGGLYCIECPSVERILAREQAALAELHRGWRDQG